MPTRSTALAIAALATLTTAASAPAQPQQAPATLEATRPAGPAAHERHGPLHGMHHRGIRPDMGPEMGMMRHRPGPVTFMLRHRDELALSPEQVERFEQLRLDAARELIRRGADVRVAELELRALRRVDPVDLAQVEQKLREMERQRTELRLTAIRAVEDAKAQLTPDQRTKLRTLFEDRMRHHRPRGGAPTSA